MKYMLLFCSSADDQKAWETMTGEARDQAYARVNQWFVDNGPLIREGYELQGPDTATTIRSNGTGETITTDGPFLEANEVVGGYAIIEVEDLDAALRLARSWPASFPVEVRPVVER